MSKIELLPCPFCGTAPEYLSVPGGMWVRCPECKASSDDSMAVEKWNRRSQPASVRAGTAKPTEAMIAAGLRVVFDNEDERATVVNIWNAMSAALEPQQEEAGYQPKLIEYEGEGEPYAEFVSADEPTMTRTGFAGELLLSLDRSKLLGIRVYTTPTQKEQESQRVSKRPEVETELEALRRLAAGDRIVYSRDGEMAWFQNGDRAWLANDVIMELHLSCSIETLNEGEGEDWHEWSQITPIGRTLLEALEASHDHVR